MIGGRYLSKKKTDSQNISISPYLKDLISRYIKVQLLKNPKDNRYKSVSAFYNYVMEAVLKIFEAGKSLDDLEKFVDKEVDQFYEEMTFKAVIPIFEQSIEMNRYSYQDQEMLIPFVSKFRDFLVTEYGEVNDETIRISWDRFSKYLLSNNLTKTISLDIFTDKYIVEYDGFYSNLHQNNVKALIALFSAFGMKISKMLYHRNYCKFEMEKEKWFGQVEVKHRAMRKLYRQNIKFVVNYFNIVNDRSHYLWIALSKVLNSMIGFKDYSNGMEEINSIINEMREYSSDTEEFKSIILKLLEHFHWITIDNLEKGQFQFKISEKNNPTELKIASTILKNFGNLNEKNEEFYFR